LITNGSHAIIRQVDSTSYKVKKKLTHLQLEN
jgi:hypothetical protein